MLQILFNHFFCHLPYRVTEAPSYLKMSTPVPLFQARQLIEMMDKYSNEKDA
jgi:hypothetical protein